MPAKSESQQRLMGMVYAYKKDGKLPDDPDLAAKVKKIAKGIKKKDAKDFASTKHKGLPDRVSEGLTFKQFLEGMADMNVSVSSIPKDGEFKLKKYVIKSPGGKTYTFDTEKQAAQHFGKSWDAIKSGDSKFKLEIRK